MKRSELLKSPEYWTTEIQLKVFDLIEKYRLRNGLTKKEIAEKLGVSKGYITQILNGDFDHKVSKLVELSLAFDKVPVLYFVDADKYIADDAAGRKDMYRQDFRPVANYTFVEGDARWPRFGTPDLPNGFELLRTQGQYSEVISVQS